MKMKSKVFGTVLLCCALVLTFTACAGCTSSEQTQNTDVKTASPTVLATDEPTETPTAVQLSKENLIGNWLYHNVISEDPCQIVGILYCFKDDGSALMSLFSSEDPELKTISLVEDVSSNEVLGNLKWKQVSDTEYEVGGKTLKYSGDSLTGTSDDGAVLVFKKYDVEY